MHQPWYREPSSGQYLLPWTYLHVIKDYVDMAAHLEANPEARAVVNFTPTLLEQIEDYARQISAFLIRGAPIRDPLLEGLACSRPPLSPLQRVPLVKACLRTNEQRLINRFAPFKRLVGIARHCLTAPESTAYLNAEFLVDLVCWYHLAWLGESVRRSSAIVAHLIKKGAAFTSEDRRALLSVIGELVAGVVDRYRRLAETGRVELSVTPYGHPILPLLLDFGSAREAMPDIGLPEHRHYPGGEVRARWHIEEAINCFKEHFGHAPRGCWPAEGGTSTATVTLLGDYGFEWVASGGGVLENSLRRSGMTPPSVHRPYRLQSAAPVCFFRDDGLSDLIGFSYATWAADDAAADLISHLLHIKKASADGPATVVSIIMDGENAWEHYPDNAYHFLTALYARLAGHPELELTTFSACVDAGLAPTPLPTLVAGSWVHGTLSTWIGDPAKNRAWDLLVDAKRSYDHRLETGQIAPAQVREAEHQLAICEGSDWFWWFGDYNPAGTVREFDYLFRRQLTALYEMTGAAVPEVLIDTVSHGGGNPLSGGVMRPGRDPQ